MSSQGTPPPPATPAGWYDDGQGRVRWWDGGSWTDAYAPVLRAVAPKSPMSGIAIAGFVVACAALLFAFGGLPGILLGVFGFILSIGGYADRKRRGRGFSVAGIIISAAGITLGGFVLAQVLS